MNNLQKAKVLDYMISHANTLLNGEVKDIDSFSAEKIILAKYSAQQFLDYLEVVKEKFM